MVQQAKLFFREMNKMVLLLRFLSILIVCFTTAVFAGTVPEYTADIINFDPDGNEEGITKVFSSEGKVCFEMPQQDVIGAMSIIVRPDLEKMFIVISDKSLYMEMPYYEKNGEFPRIIPMPDMPVPKIAKEEAGEEKINGYNTKKIFVTITTDMNGQEVSWTNVEWKAEEFDIPIRSEDEDGSVTELHNIKLVSVPKSKFDVKTDGLQQIDNFMQLFELQ